MRIKKRRFICCVLVFLIAISGMYFDNTQSKSIFSCASDINNAVYIHLADKTYDDNCACTAEVLGIRSHVVIKQMSNGSLGSKRVIKNSIDFLPVDIINLSQVILFSKSEVNQFCNSFQDEFITTYIHKSDGKKRINSISL